MDTGIWNCDYDNDPEESFGFVYLITNTSTDRKYIGKKQYYAYKKKKKWKPSNWKKYTSSSRTVNEDIEQYGMDNFKFEMLFDCSTKAGLTYSEVKMQYDCNVLTARDDTGEREYYNGMIGAIKFIPGHDVSDETREKMKRATTKMWKDGVFDNRESNGCNNGMYGKKHTEETKLAMSKKRKGFVQSKDTIAKRVAKNTGQKRTTEQKLNLAAGQLGKKKPTHTCVKCGKTMSIMNAKRYGHYDEVCK